MREIKDAVHKTVLVFSFLFFVIIFAISQINYIYTKRSLHNEMKEAYSVILRQMQTNVDTQLRNIDSAVINLMNNNRISNFIDNYYTQYIVENEVLMGLQDSLIMLQRSDNNIDSIYIYSNKSKEILSNEIYTDISNFKDISWMNSLPQVLSFKWIGRRDILDSNGHEKSVISMIRSYPVNTTWKTAQGTIVVNLRDDIIKGIIKKTELNEENVFFICNSDGDMITYNKMSDEMGNIGSEPYFKQMLLEEEGGFKAKYQNKNCLIIYTTSKYTNWKYASVISLKTLDAPLNNIRMGSILFSAFMIALSIIATYFIGKWSYKPVSDFVHVLSKKIKENNPPEKIKKDFDGFSDLEEEFDEVIVRSRNMQNQINNNITVMKWYTVMDLLMGRKTINDNIDSELSMLGMNLISSCYTVILIEVYEKSTYYSQKKIKELKFITASICDKAQSFINMEQKGSVIQINDGTIAAIIGFDSLNELNSMFVLTLAENLIQFVKNYYDTPIWVAVGGIYQNMGEINKSYRDALEAMKYKMLVGNGGIVSIDDFRISAQENVDDIMRKIDILSQNFFELSQSQLKIEITDIVKMMTDNKLSGNLIKQLSFQIIIQSVTNCSKKFLVNNDMFHGTYSGASSIINVCDSIEQIVEALVDVLYTITCSIHNTKQDTLSASPIVNKVVSYINKNYSNSDISLNIIASELDINVSYLSELFKKVTGKKFIEYLITKRIEKAKCLILEGEKISEIAKMVGYENQSSFVRIFKKYTGVTPSSYKNDNTAI